MNDTTWLILLTKVHAESHKDKPDKERLQSMIYEAVHLSHHDPTAFFAGGMALRRVGMKRESDAYFHEADTRGDAVENQRIRQKYA